MLRVYDHQTVRLRPGCDPVVDLASGHVVGWELGAKALVDLEPIDALVATRATLPTGQFVLLRISARALGEWPGPRAPRIAGRLDGVALVLRGRMSRDGLMLLEELREQGALVGCDTAAALVHFTALAPDILSLPEPLGADAAAASAAGGLVAILAAMGAAIGAKPLAHGVAAAAQARSLAELGVAMAQGDASGPRTSVAVADPRSRSASFRRSGRWRSRGLAQARPSLPATEPTSAIVEACLSDDDHDWLVLVDEARQPVRLVERAALLRGEPFEHRAVAIHPATSLEELARAALDRPAVDRSRPLVLCDAAGRYRGLLMVERTAAVLGA
jgi:hypothetical protein